MSSQVHIEVFGRWRTLSLVVDCDIEFGLHIFLFLCHISCRLEREGVAKESVREVVVVVDEVGTQLYTSTREERDHVIYSHMLHRLTPIDYLIMFAMSVTQYLRVLFSNFPLLDT